MGTRIYRVPGGDPATSGNVNFEGAAAAPAPPSALTGNPYIDNWGTPSAADDEFADGGADLALRGWSVYRRDTLAPITRIGGLASPDGSVEPSQYRSARYGTYLILQASLTANGIVMMRDVPISRNQQFMVRVGLPWGRPLATGNSSSTVLSGDVQVGIVRSNAAPGSQPYTPGAKYDRFFVGQRAGANAYYGLVNTAPLNRLQDATDQYSSPQLLGNTGLWASDRDGALHNFALLNTESGAVHATWVNDDYTDPFTPQQVGLDLYSPASNNTGGGALATFMIDYFRVRPNFDWYGMSG